MSCWLGHNIPCLSWCYSEGPIKINRLLGIFIARAVFSYRFKLSTNRETPIKILNNFLPMLALIQYQKKVFF